MVSKRFFKYLIKKLILYTVIFFAACTVNFIIPRLVPGDPIQGILSMLQQQGQVTEKGMELVESYKRRFGLDDPWYIQFIKYYERFFQGDLGPSIMAFPMSVSELIFQALPWTIGLLAITTLISWVVGNILGLFVGWNRGRKIDSIVSPIALCLSQIPYYFAALFLIFLLAYLIPIFPMEGGYSVGLTPQLTITFITDVIYHAVLPALSIMVVSIGGWMIAMRSLIINILGEDYLLLAKAKGLKSGYIMWKYTFKNALLPQVTGLAIALGYVLNGFMLMEILFGYPGIGTLLYTAVNRLDYNVVQGILTFSIGAVLAANLLIEILYPFIDPRIEV